MIRLLILSTHSVPCFIATWFGGYDPCISIQPIVSAVYWTTDYCNYRATKQIIRKSNSLDLPLFKKSIYLFRYTNNSLCVYIYILFWVLLYMDVVVICGHICIYITHIYNIYIYIYIYEIAYVIRNMPSTIICLPGWHKPRPWVWGLKDGFLQGESGWSS